MTIDQDHYIIFKAGLVSQVKDIAETVNNALDPISENLRALIFTLNLFQARNRESRNFKPFFALDNDNFLLRLRNIVEYFFLIIDVWLDVSYAFFITKILSWFKIQLQNRLKSRNQFFFLFFPFPQTCLLVV